MQRQVEHGVAATVEGGVVTVGAGGTSIIFHSFSGSWGWCIDTFETSVNPVPDARTITAALPGVVMVSYMVTNSCGTATTSYTVNVLPAAACNTGVATVPASSVISIYPNPTNGSFIVDIPQPGNDAVITITDISGKVVEVIKQASHELQIPVYLTNLASGTYLIKVEADGKTYRDKVVLW